MDIDDAVDDEMENEDEDPALVDIAAAAFPVDHNAREQHALPSAEPDSNVEAEIELDGFRTRRGAAKRHYEEKSDHESDSEDFLGGGHKKRKYTFKGKTCLACGATNGTRAKHCVKCHHKYPVNTLKPKPTKRPPLFKPQLDDDGTPVVEFVATKRIEQGFEPSANGKFAKRYACRTLGGSRLRVIWLSAEEALRLGKRSRAAFLRFANKIVEEETETEDVERILDCRIALELPLRFLASSASNSHGCQNHELLPLPEFAYFGLLPALGSGGSVDGHLPLGDWFTEYHTLKDEDQELSGPSPCRGRIVAAILDDKTNLEYEVAFATGELADSRRVVDGIYLGKRPTRKVGCEVAIGACIVANLCEDVDSGPFVAPVPLALYPTYAATIAPNQPMDLGTVLQRLDSGGFKDTNEIQRTVRSIWDNCKRFNTAQSLIGIIADALGMRCERLFRTWLKCDNTVLECDDYDIAVACMHCDRPCARSGPGQSDRCGRCLKAGGGQGELPRRSEELIQLSRGESVTSSALESEPRREYLVKWHNRSYEECSWEAAEDIAGDQVTERAIASYFSRCNCSVESNRQEQQSPTCASPGSLYAVVLKKAEIPRIDIQSVTYADIHTHDARHALRVSHIRATPVSFVTPINVGDIICCIGTLEVLGRSLGEIGQQVQAALTTALVKLRLYRPRAGVDGSTAARAADAANQSPTTPFLNLEHLSMAKRRKKPLPSHISAPDGLELSLAPDTKIVRTLRDYQEVGVAWMVGNHARGRGCILADEMGLGKTAQTCCVLDRILGSMRGEAMALVVVPLSTIEQWRRELAVWAPRLEICVYHDATSRGRELMRHFEWGEGTSPKFDVLVATYETVTHDAALLARCGAPWHICVVDEAHRLKNDRSQLAASLEKTLAHTPILKQWRLLITGTPLQNNLRELWSLLHFADRGSFEKPDAFFAEFSSVESGNIDQLAKLHAVLEPRLLRRVKEDVAKDIPEKKETVIDVELTTIQKRLYRAIYEKSASLLGSMNCGVAGLNYVQMSLRNACNHALLVRGIDDTLLNEPDSLVKGSGKFILLTKLLPRLKSEGRKVLIFSQFVRLIYLLAELCDSRGFKYERLDGTVKMAARQKSIDRFNDGRSETFIFLLSTRAGGVGLNLQAADTVIIFDSDWNPQNDVQAQARCHRLGQTKDVMVYRLVASRSFEGEMFERASRKLGLEKAVLGAGGNDRDDRAEPDRRQLEELLKKGAYALLQNDEDERTRSDQYADASIDSILGERASTRVIMHATSKANFSSGIHAVTTRFGLGKSEAMGGGVALDDPDFWAKLCPDSPATAATLKERLNRCGAQAPLQDETKWVSDLMSLCKELVDRFDVDALNEKNALRDIALVASLRTQQFSSDSLDEICRLHSLLDSTRRRACRDERDVLPVMNLETSLPVTIVNHAICHTTSARMSAQITKEKLHRSESRSAGYYQRRALMHIAPYVSTLEHSILVDVQFELRQDRDHATRVAAWAMREESLRLERLRAAQERLQFEEGERQERVRRVEEARHARALLNARKLLKTSALKTNHERKMAAWVAECNQNGTRLASTREISCPDLNIESQKIDFAADSEDDTPISEMRRMVRRQTPEVSARLPKAPLTCSSQGCSVSYDGGTHRETQATRPIIFPCGPLSNSSEGVGGRNTSKAPPPPWTAQEDNALTLLVTRHGAVNNWALISRGMATPRTSKQCRERWQTSADPNINKAPLSVEEDLLLIEAVLEHGTKWAEIARLLPGRTDNSLKRHWNSTLKLGVISFCKRVPDAVNKVQAKAPEAAAIIAAILEECKRECASKNGARSPKIPPKRQPKRNWRIMGHHLLGAYVALPGNAPELNEPRIGRLDAVATTLELGANTLSFRATHLLGPRRGELVELFEADLHPTRNITALLGKDMSVELLETIEGGEDSAFEVFKAQKRLEERIANVPVEWRHFFGQMLWAKDKKNEPWWPATALDPRSFRIGDPVRDRAAKYVGSKHVVRFFGLPPAKSLGFVALSGLRPYCSEPPEDSLKALKRCSKRKQDDWRLACAEAALEAQQRSVTNRPTRDPPPIGSHISITWDGEGDFDCLVIRDAVTGSLHVSHPAWDETIPFDPDEDEWRPA